MTLSSLNRCALCTLLLSFAGAAQAAIIDFETTPAAGTPLDNAALSTPYAIVGGGTVQFFFDRNGNNSYDSGVDQDPIFEAYGADSAEGFANSVTSVPDTANGGLSGQLGSFFLRQVVPGTPPFPFLVDYNTPQTINALSGEIWDIDGEPQGTEQWKVEILDASNNVLTSTLSPLGSSGALDGLPWTFSFTGLPSGVDKVRITFVGTKINGLGLAFNNFSPTTVPEPSTLLLAGLRAMGLAVRTARRRLRRS